jgi:hypothetical protein
MVSASRFTFSGEVEVEVKGFLEKNALTLTTSGWSKISKDIGEAFPRVNQDSLAVRFWSDYLAIDE